MVTSEAAPESLKRPSVVRPIKSDLYIGTVFLFFYRAHDVYLFGISPQSINTLGQAPVNPTR
jgi:hypothetical protein